MAPTYAAEDCWISPAMLAAGTNGFYPRLWGGLRTASGADHISQLTYDSDGHVLRAAAVSWINQQSVEVAVDIYASRLYARDPNYPLIRVGKQAGTEIHVLSQSSSSIVDKEYRGLMFDAPGFIGKASLIGKCERQIYYLNLYFSKHSATASRALDVLKKYGATLTCLARHHELLADGARLGVDADDLSELTTLSARERQVVALLREGRTAKEVAKALGLSPTTVITYKSRIFEKLGIKNMKELFLDRRH